MAGTITHEWNGTVLTITSDSGTSSCDLKGEKGDDGPRGAQGIKGSKGDTGAQGMQGIQGEKGEPGAQGLPGDKGEKGDTGAQGAPFTYNDFTTEQLASLKGEKGEKGDKGESGKNGMGVPIGGSTGQVLVKATGNDYDTAWRDSNQTFDLLSVYPIGSIYLSVTETNPADLFGGTWERITDAFLFGASESIPAGATTDEKESLLSAIGAMSVNYGVDTASGNSYKGRVLGVVPDYANTTTSMVRLNNLDISIMPPFLAVYIWKRIA